MKKSGYGNIRGRRFFVLPVCAPVFLAALVSCATGSFAKVDNAVSREDFLGGAGILEASKSSYYTNRDTILYYLDKGMLTHYAGLYGESSRLLEEGERAIEAAFTKSLTMEIGTYLLNDNVREYAGEDYEDIYINAFNALNYYHRGDLEGALVEIRRMNNKARYLADKYGVVLTSLQKKALEESAVLPPVPPPDANAPSNFTDSALARYLGMLFYRGAGHPDDARIDRDRLQVIFANSPNLYPHPVPSSVREEGEIPPGMARLNVLAFSGLSPVKEEVMLRIFLSGSRWIKIVLPEMVSRRSEVGKIEVVFDDGRTFALELLEDIEAVAGETFKERKNVIYIKTIIRSAMKSATSAVLDAASEEAEGNMGIALGVLSILTQVYAEASEQADLRISRYFPAKAWVGGINLEPGIYSFRVNYYGHSGRPLVSLEYNDMTIREGALNLTEAVCLK
ncbi:MAG: hypothetical protein LBP43_07105 [Treponema sp.]|jgi:hypothetical protein|nr:hypothetical protein [Treponema sp.]